MRPRFVLIGGAAAAILAAIVAGVAIFVLGAAGPSTASVVREAGCQYRTYPATTSEHVAPTAKVNYNSFPPTNGPMANEMVIWGAYDQPVVGQMQLIHNLEHGGVVIQYGSKVGASTVARLNDFYREDPNGLVLAPLPRLGSKIAVAAWNAPDPGGSAAGKQDLGNGILALCPRFDEQAFSAFVESHRYKGLERTGRDTLEPGR